MPTPQTAGEENKLSKVLSFSFFFRADREEMRQKARGEDVEMKDTLIGNMESNIELQVPFEPK